jgi:hypothetical protein
MPTASHAAKIAARLTNAQKVALDSREVRVHRRSGRTIQSLFRLKLVTKPRVVMGTTQDMWFARRTALGTAVRKQLDRVRVRRASAPHNVARRRGFDHYGRARDSRREWKGEITGERVTYRRLPDGRRIAVIVQGPYRGRID